MIIYDMQVQSSSICLVNDIVFYITLNDRLSLSLIDGHKDLYSYALE